jgi:predicted CoA-binding protein
MGEPVANLVLRDSPAAIHEAVMGARSIHVLGAGLNPERPAHRAIHDLNGKGWRLVPVHLKDAGGSILGRPIRPNIEVGTVPDIVVFFLAPERAKAVVIELMIRFPLAEMPLLWFQPGSEHEDVLEMLNQADVPHVVEDCIVQFVQRHHLTATHPEQLKQWYLQRASSEGDGCSVWEVHERNSTVTSPPESLEWCGDFIDLMTSHHTIPNYIRSLKSSDESLEEVAIRLAGNA